MGIFSGKNVLITGGTGSLGKHLVKRLLGGEQGMPEKIVIFSRDEAKQHAMRLQYQNKKVATDEVIYRNFKQKVQFIIGNVRDYHSLCKALYNVDIVFNAAALKQVPTCEYFPYEAVQTNITGSNNIVRAIKEHSISVDLVIGVSTDKACKPVNLYGMTKAIQERIFLKANLDIDYTRFICVRYGNVIASRGSVIPLFLEQVKNGGPLTITSEEMTRFFINLDKAVNTIFEAVNKAKKGEIYIPKAPSAKIIDLAKCLIRDRDIKIKKIGVRPGEKIHEILISEEECHRVDEKREYFVLKSILPELGGGKRFDSDSIWEYSSQQNNLRIEELRELLKENSIL